MLITKIYQKICDVSLFNPSKVAFYEEEKIYSYGDLKRAIDNRVQQLASLNLEPGKKVGLFISNSYDAYGLVYACSLLGLTYIPLPVDDPVQRIQSIIELADLSCILCEEKNSKNLAAILDHVTMKEKPGLFCFDSNVQVEAEEDIFKLISATDKHPLYMLFTSGSTGTPKGVLIMPSGVENFINWSVDHLKVLPTDIFLAHSRLTFDLSVFNLFVPFLSGAAVRIVKSKVEQMYPGILLNKGVTIALMVPRVTGLLQESAQLFKNSFPSLRHLLFCGEKLYAAQANAWISTHQNLTLHNIYGPTETTVTCTYHTLAAGLEVSDPVAIGVSIPNMQLNYLNESGELVNGPTTGELIISGIGVSPGDYCGQKTDRFFDHKELGRSFKTGDIVERDASGQHFWISRRDNQVKVRGFRVELSEIETVLSAHPNIIDLICILDSESQRLFAVMSLKPKSDLEVTVVELKAICEKMFPAYMRPAQFIALKEIPRNSNGKADRQKAKELVEKSIN